MTDAPEHVGYDFFGGAGYAVRHRGAELPGVNDWATPVDPRQPVPVVLVHGTAGSAVTNWFTLAPELHNAGYRVFAPTYGVLPGARFPLSQFGGLRELHSHSVPEVAAFVRRVLETTGAEQVDLVGHSQGGLIAGDIAKRVLPGRVRRVVTLAAPWSGVGYERLTWLLRAAGVTRLVEDASGMLGDMVHGSAYLEGLHAEGGTAYARGVVYTNIETRFDEFVVPHSAALPEPPADGGYEVSNVVLQHGCILDAVDHAALPSDPRAVDFVLGALDPATARRPRCLPSAPWIGGLLPSILVDHAPHPGAVSHPAAAPPRTPVAWGHDRSRREDPRQDHRPPRTP